jgi:hypothetical protein
MSRDEGTVSLPRWRVIGLLLLAAGFGAADQWLGTSHLPGGYNPVATTISGLSAPWLLVAFCSGCTQTRPWKGAFIGLGATLAALAGYFAMMWSPAEGVHMTLATMGHQVIRTQAQNVIGGLITGPVYGWLGHRWRVGKSVLSALLAASPMPLEPIALVLAGLAWGPPAAYVAEVIAGILLAGYFIAAASRSRRVTQEAA